MKTSLKTNIPAGIITRFSVPVPSDQIKITTPVTAKGRRRQLSFKNAKNELGEKTSLNEWIEMIKEEDEGEQDYDVVKTRKESVANVGKENFQNVKLSENVQIKAQIECYDAILIGTDDDFLQKSKFRTIFKENAAKAEDTVLFEMEPYNGPVAPNSTQVETDPTGCSRKLFFSDYTCYFILGFFMLGGLFFLIMATRTS